MANLINEAKRMQQLAGLINESQLNESIKSIDFKTLKQVDGNEIKPTDLKVGETRVAANMSYGSAEQLQQNSGIVSKIEGDKVTFDINNGSQKAMDLADLLLVTNFSAQPQAESLDIESVVNEALAKVRKK